MGGRPATAALRQRRVGRPFPPHGARKAAADRLAAGRSAAALAVATLAGLLSQPAVPHELAGEPPGRTAELEPAALEVLGPPVASAPVRRELALTSFMRTGAWLLAYARTCEPAEFGDVERVMEFAIRKLAPFDAPPQPMRRLAVLARSAERSAPERDCRALAAEAPSWLARWDLQVRALAKRPSND